MRGRPDERLLYVGNHEVLEALFPLQSRRFSRGGEIGHLYFTLQVLQEGVVRVEVYDREQARRANLLPVRTSGDPVLSLKQPIEVKRHAKSGIG